MKKFLCYDTNDAASGKINVSVNGVLKPNSTVPSTNGAANQCLVTDGDGNVKWEDRLAYEGVGLTEELNQTFTGSLNAASGIYETTKPYFNKYFDQGQKYTVSFNGEIYKCETKGPFEPYGGIGNLSVNNRGEEDTGEPFYFLTDIEGNLWLSWKESYGETVSIIIYSESEKPFPIDEKFIPVMSSVTLKSSTASSTKKFKITVNDSGTITATEV